MKSSKKIHFYFSITAIIFLITYPAVAEDILLGRPTDESITVNVIPDQSGELSFEYGTTSGVYGPPTSAIPCTIDEPVETVITGLSPNTRYYYRMLYRATSGSPWTAGDEHSFYTQRVPDSTFTFTIIADSHMNGGGGNVTTYQNTLNNVAADHPDFHFDLGDTFWMDGVTTAAVANQHYLNQRQWMSVISHSASIFIATGNHENEEGWNFDDPNSKALLSINARKLYYPSPIPGGSFYTGNTDTLAAINGDHYREDYYAWEWSDALFVVIDPFQYTMTNPYGTAGGEEDDEIASGDSWNWTLGEQQYLWFKNVLENSNAKYKFVFAHHVVGGMPSYLYVRGGAEAVPYYEWGGKNWSGTWEFDTKRPGWEAPIHQLMVANHVTAFFHGHDHEYAYEKRDGIIYQLVPQPGNTGYGFNLYHESDPNTIKVLPSPGHLRVTVSPSQATVDYVGTSSGTVNYSYTILTDSNNTPPVAVDDSATTPKDTMVNINVLANDSDDDGDPLSVDNVSDPPHGIAVIQPDYTINYTPDTGYTGPDSFTYDINDGNGGTDSATVSITVTGNTNTPPVAVDDSATTPKDTMVNINVLANDSDDDGDPLSVDNVSDPPHGIAVIQPDYTINYTPDTGYTGPDSFTYDINDGNGGTDSATVSITVTGAPAGGISYIGDIGAATIKTSGTSLVITTTAAVAAGDDIIIAYATDPFPNLSVSVADSVGNIYEQAAMAENYGYGRTYIFAAYNVNALPIGSTITITSNGTVMARTAVVSVFHGLAPSGALDQTSIGSGSSTSPSSGATATTTQAYELLIGAIGTEGPVTDNPGTWDYSFTAGPRAGTTGGIANTNWTVSMGYRIVSATGAYTAQKSGITSRYWAAAIATFKAEAVEPTPTITVVGTPLNAFSSEPGVPSAEQSYTVSGSNLTDGITITAPTDFEVSTTSGSGFGSSVILPQVGGSVVATPIYVRFNRATEGASSGDISHTSSGATTQNVAVSGTAAVPGEITYIGDVGSVAVNTAGTTLSIPVGPAGVAAGNTIIVGFASRGAETYDEPVVTDSAGNTYNLATVAVTYQHGRSYIYYAYVENALVNGDNITITTSSVASRVAVASVFSGLLNIDVLDQALGYPSLSSQTTAQSNNPSVGPTGTTSQADELIIGVIGTEEATDAGIGTWENDFETGPQIKTSGASYEWRVSLGYKIVSAIGEFTAAKTVANNPYWAASIATFKAGAAVPTPPSFNILLGRPTDHSITANIIPDQNVMFYFEYGTGPGSYDANTGTFLCLADEPNEVVIDGLDPNTQYYYRIVSLYTGNPNWVAGDEYSFHTQKAPGSTFTFTIIADSHFGQYGGKTADEIALYEQTLLNVGADQPDFHIDLGDAFPMDPQPLGTGMTEAEADEAYLVQRPYMGLISNSIPIYLIIGNHENEEGWNFDDVFTAPDKSLAIVGLQARKKYFPNPIPDDFYSGNVDPLPEAIGGDTYHEDYYAWQWGDALFVVLDPFHYTMIWPSEGTTYGGEGNDGEAEGDRWDWTLGIEQYLWLKNTLENSNAKYKFVLSHHVTGGATPYGRGGIEAAPYFEWGGHNADGTWGWDTERPESEGWDVPIHQLMVDNGVDIFFHGHDHIFAYEELDGIVYQECPKPDDAGYDWEPYGYGYTEGLYPNGYLIQNSGHIRVTVSPNNVTVDYVRAYLPGDGTNGEVAHSYTIVAEPNVITYDLVMSVNPEGSGTTNPAVGVHTYPEDNNVAITAIPNTGYVFDHWEGDVANPGSASTTVTMDVNQSVTAHFAAIQYALTINVVGSGSVTKAPNQSTYSYGTVVTLTAEPNTGWLFNSWSGDINGVANPTAITMDSNKTVTATFNILTYTIAGTVTLNSIGFDGVTMNGLPGNPVTSGGGLYSATVDYGWSGKVAPVKYAYGFEPNDRTYTNVVADQGGQDYSGKLLTYIISGYVHNQCGAPIKGVVLTASTGGSLDITDANGYYEVLVDYNWSGTVTPTKEHHTFNPVEMVYVDVLAGQTEQNYQATNIYDLDCDGSVSFGDLRIISENWLDGPGLPGDFYKDGDEIVNILDFADFANAWGY